MWWLVLVVCVLTLLVYATCIVPTKWVDVVEVESELGLGKRALQITDLHVEMLRVKPSRIVQVARAANIDYIFFTGDFLTEERRLAKLSRVLEPLRSLNVPMYAVLGNHDYRVRHLEKLLDLLSSKSIQVLRNESLRVDDFWLVGIDDLTSRKSNVEKAFRGVSDNEPRIVLTHDPNLVLQIHQPYQLLMSGHLHGKQFRVPFLFHMKNMGPLPRQGIYQGLHRFPQGPIYISKGLSQVGLNARFLVRCELTIHKL